MQLSKPQAPSNVSTLIVRLTFKSTPKRRVKYIYATPVRPLFAFLVILRLRLVAHVIVSTTQSSRLMRTVQIVVATSKNNLMEPVLITNPTLSVRLMTQLGSIEDGKVAMKYSRNPVSRAYRPSRTSVKTF